MFLDLPQLQARRAAPASALVRAASGDAAALLACTLSPASLRTQISEDLGVCGSTTWPPCRDGGSAAAALATARRRMIMIHQNFPPLLLLLLLPASSSAATPSRFNLPGPSSGAGQPLPLTIEILEGVNVTLDFVRRTTAQVEVLHSSHGDLLQCSDGSFASGAPCDGNSDCGDGSDEHACGSSHFGGDSLGSKLWASSITLAAWLEANPQEVRVNVLSARHTLPAVYGSRVPHISSRPGCGALNSVHDCVLILGMDRS